ncbi:hypothetical protein NHQ30_004240 [Ciborinia camelliae]|nr:hypothetical protein NHQ30_004240 [Ciborinia camelliae]
MTDTIRPPVDRREFRRRRVSIPARYASGRSREVSIVQGTNVVVSTINYARVMHASSFVNPTSTSRYPRETIPLQIMRSSIRAKVCPDNARILYSLWKVKKTDILSRDVVIRHEKSFHRLENPRRQPPPLQPSSPDADADAEPEPFQDTIVLNTHNHSTNTQVPIKLEQQETPEMQSTLDPLLREHDAQLAGHSGSSGPHMNGHGGPNHAFHQYQNGFIDPALDISDLFGPSPNLIARP